MFHILDLRDESVVFGHTFVVLYEMFFEIHNVLVGGLLGAVDIDEPEVGVFRGFDESQLGEVA